MRRLSGSWQEYAPTITGGIFTKVMRQLYPDAPIPPPNSSIRFADKKMEMKGAIAVKSI